MTLIELTQRYCAEAETPFWERCLRRSVRLQLGLAEPQLRRRDVLADLRLVERSLCWHLRQSHPPTADTPEAEATALAVVQLYQMALLGHQAECAALRRAQPLAYYRWQHPAGRARPTSGCLALAA